MEDKRIIALFFARDEAALAEVKRKYGHYCYAIAYNILKCREDAEECENDTYLDAWRQIPPNVPHPLSSFLGMLTRRISLDRLRKRNARKRGGGEVILSFEELEDCIPDGGGIDVSIDADRLADVISKFLSSLPRTEADVFVRRYWYFDSIATIARNYGYGISRVKMMLMRTRERLRIRLEEEGFFV